jgi:HlyD family secretion protein
MTEQQIVANASVGSAPTQPASVAPEPAAAHPRRRRILIIGAVLLASLVIWRVFFASSSVPANIVVLSGRIEGDDSAVAPKVTGRILEVRMREGDTVKAGDVIAILDDDQIRAQEDAARAALTEAEAQGRAARDEIAVLQEQLRENQLMTAQAGVDTRGRVGQAEADLAAAQADLSQAQAAYDLAAFDRDAYTKLAQSGAVSERQGKQAVATAEQDAAAVAAAKRHVESAEAALTTAQATAANPPIHGAQETGVQKQLVQQESQIASAAASTERARAQLAEAEANRADLTVKAPFGGTVMTRAAEPGEVVQAGTAIVTLLDMSKVYLRGFVPEGQIGKVALGQPAHIFLDSNPKQAVDAYVLRVDPEATFTPENTYFRDDRVKQVVGVKLQLTQAIGFAKPGMPADGEILVNGTVWPKGGGRE